MMFYKFKNTITQLAQNINCQSALLVTFFIEDRYSDREIFKDRL